VGDVLTKPLDHGGLNLSRITSSLVIAVGMIMAILFTPREAGRHPGAHGGTAM
jgi:uncharacterized membrane-anchored protein